MKPLVVAVYEPGLGFGDITLPQETVREHSTRQMRDSVFVAMTPGADRDTVRKELRRVSRHYPGSEVLDRSGLSAAQERQALVPVLPLITVSLGLTGSPIPCIPPQFSLAVIAGTTAIAAPAVLLPTRWALRTPPVEAIGLRE